MKFNRVIKTMSAVSGVALAVAFSTNAFAGASITGKVTFNGDVPTLPVIQMSADPKCEAKYAGKPAPTAEVLVLGTAKELANVYVHIKSGLAAKEYPVPAEPVVIDQNGCKYMPRVTVVRKGQALKIMNDDGTLHNVHAMPQVNSAFNEAMPAFRKEVQHVFDKVEDTAFGIKCDVHPWMNGYIAVTDNPYTAVTSVDGTYTIKDLEPGTYTVEYWHEKLGAKTETITVTADQAVTKDVALEKPAAVGMLDYVIIKN